MCVGLVGRGSGVAGLLDAVQVQGLGGTGGCEGHVVPGVVGDGAGRAERRRGGAAARVVVPVQFVVAADVQQRRVGAGDGGRAGDRRRLGADDDALGGGLEPEFEAAVVRTELHGGRQFGVRGAAVEGGGLGVAERAGRPERHPAVRAVAAVHLVEGRGRTRRLAEAVVAGRCGAEHRAPVGLAGAGDGGRRELPDSAVLVGELRQRRGRRVVRHRGEGLAGRSLDRGEQAGGVSAVLVEGVDVGGDQRPPVPGRVGDRAVEVRRVPGAVGGAAVRLVGPVTAEEAGAEVVEDLVLAEGHRALDGDGAGARADLRVVQEQRLRVARGTQHHVVPLAVGHGGRGHDRVDAAAVPELGVQLSVGSDVDRRCVETGGLPRSDRLRGVGVEHARSGRGLEPQGQRAGVGVVAGVLRQRDVGGGSVEGGRGGGGTGERAGRAERHVLVGGVLGALVGEDRVLCGRAGALRERPGRARVEVEGGVLVLRAGRVAVGRALRRRQRCAHGRQLVAGVAVVPGQCGRRVAGGDRVGGDGRDVRGEGAGRCGPGEVQGAGGDAGLHLRDVSAGPGERDGTPVGVRDGRESVVARRQQCGEGVDRVVLVGQFVAAADRGEGGPAAGPRREGAVAVLAVADL